MTRLAAILVLACAVQPAGADPSDADPVPPPPTPPVAAGGRLDPVVALPSEAPRPAGRPAMVGGGS